MSVTAVRRSLRLLAAGLGGLLAAALLLAGPASAKPAPGHGHRAAAGRTHAHGTQLLHRAPAGRTHARGHAAEVQALKVRATRPGAGPRNAAGRAARLRRAVAKHDAAARRAATKQTAALRELATTQTATATERAAAARRAATKQAAALRKLAARANPRAARARAKTRPAGKALGRSRGNGQPRAAAGRHVPTGAQRTVLTSRSRRLTPGPVTTRRETAVPPVRHRSARPRPVAHPPASHPTPPKQTAPWPSADAMPPAVQQVLDHLQRMSPFAGPLGWAFGIVAGVAVVMIALSLSIGHRRTR